MIIGNPLITTNYISDSFSGDASTVAFTLSQAPASAASIAVYISGLYQIPTSAYSISGTTLTFTGAPPTGTNNITVLHLGVKSATLVPVNGSVTPQMLSTANVVYWSASNNNVGIGNVTPTSLLTVTGTAALGNTTITGTLTTSSNTVTLGTGVYIDSAGNMGVGNSTPGSYAKLAVHGYVTVGGVNYTARLTDGGYNTLLIGHQSGITSLASDAALTLSSSNVERMRIAANGDIRFISASAYNGAQVAKFQWVNENQAGVMSQIACIREQYGNAPGALAFYTSPNVDTNGYTPFERLRIDSSGNVKIANTSGVIQNAAGRTIMGQSGSILQVVTTTKTDTTSTTSSTYGDVAGMSVSITPSSTSSRILLLVNILWGHNGTDVGHSYIYALRDSTIINPATSLSNSSGGNIVGNFLDRETQHAGIILVDSPGSTSSLTYKIQWRTTAGTVYLNRSGRDSDNVNYDGRSTSSITVMEIAG